MESANNGSQWFTLQVMSGQENKVVESLTNRRAKDLMNGIDHGLDEILLPTTKVVERRDHKDYVREQKSYPGYVFVKARIYDESGRIIPDHWMFVKDTKGVINFMGGGNPIALSDKEVSDLQQVSDDSEKAKPEKSWHVGDIIVLKEGDLDGMEGVVEHVDEEHHRLKASITIFGRQTIIDADFWQVGVPEEPRD